MFHFRKCRFKNWWNIRKSAWKFRGWPGISKMSEMETERRFQKYRFSRNIYSKRSKHKENPTGNVMNGREFPNIWNGKIETFSKCGFSRNVFQKWSKVRKTLCEISWMSGNFQNNGRRESCLFKISVLENLF